MNVGVFLPNWIGDMVMATPTLRGLRDHLGPAATITGVARPIAADVLAGTNWLSDFLWFDPKGKDKSRQSWAVAGELRRRRLDAVLLLTNSLRAAAIAWASRANRRIGFVRYGRGPLLTDRLYPPRDGREFNPISAVDYYLQVAEAFGCCQREKRMELATTAGEEQRANRVWQRLKLDDARHVITLNTGGAYGAAKSWPEEHFASLAGMLAGELDARVLILCGPAERDAANRIARMAGDLRVHSLASQPSSIGLSKAVVKRSRLLISTDSGPRHFAAAFNVPVVSLFGPTDPRWSHTYHGRELELFKEVECGPCGKRTCPLKHHRCMRDLTAERVFAAANQLLTRRSERAA